jgi:hypothetical protein
MIINQTSKTKKEGTIMDAGKMNIKIWGFIGISVITAWLLGFVIEAQAETMKCRTAGVITKQEAVPVGDEGHLLGLTIREGLAFFENGEIATYTAKSIWDATMGKVFKSNGYIFYKFEDGSTIVTTSDQRSIADPSGNFSSRITGEILEGTGRFEGIKGGISTIGKQFPDVKGEANKSSTDVIFTYTRSPM